MNFKRGRRLGSRGRRVPALLQGPDKTVRDRNRGDSIPDLAFRLVRKAAYFGFCSGFCSGTATAAVVVCASAFFVATGVPLA